MLSMSNKDVIATAFQGFEKQILDTAEKELRKYCWSLLNSAIKSREQNDRAHNFTGNLLNSIVVCLYRRKSPVIAYFAADLVPEAIHPKMTRRKNPYFFNQDYKGEKSSYRPEVKTNMGWGRHDAEAFFENYVPRGKNLFDVVVAYPVEYADWVETKRKTTGILQTKDDALKIGMTFMQLKAA